MIEQDPLRQEATPLDPDGARLVALRLLERRPELSQRQLAASLGVSLGKAHYVLRALLDKGLVKARRFRQSDNKLAYAYVLTPSGLREKVRLTGAFLARKEREFEALRETIAVLRREHQDLKNATGDEPAESTNGTIHGKED